MEIEDIELRETKKLKRLRVILWVLYFGLIIFTMTLAILRDVGRGF
jgi:hypothetical protein